MGGGAYNEQPTAVMSRDEILQAYYEQQKQMKERQQRLLGQRSSSSASMVRENLDSLTLQQQMATPPRKPVHHRIHTPESQ